MPTLVTQFQTTQLFEAGLLTPFVFNTEQMPTSVSATISRVSAAYESQKETKDV